jgi:hypothetical protein
METCRMDNEKMGKEKGKREMSDWSGSLRGSVTYRWESYGGGGIIILHRFVSHNSK